MAIGSTRNTVPHRWMSLPDGWDTGWKAARSASGSSPAYVAVIGDSDALGWQSTDLMAKAFNRLLRNNLVAKYGSYGDYWPVSLSARYNAVTGSGTPGGTMPWTFDSSWGGSVAGPQINYNSFGASIFQDTGTFPMSWVNAGSGMFVTPYACTALDIIWHDYNTTGTWKYSVDDAAGASLVTVTDGAWNSMRRVSITGLSNAVHTVRFGAGSAANTLGLTGIVTYDPTNAKTKGIGFALNAAGNIRAYDWLVSPNQIPPDRAAQWQGRSKTAAAVEQMTGFGFPTQPHLAVIQLGIVDCVYNVGIAQFRLALRKLCDSLRRGQDSCSIVFLICPNPNPASSDQTTGFTRSEMWSLYADQIYGVASEYQCAVLNLHADWMSTPVAQGFTTANDAHPTDLGHQTIANALTQIIV